MLSISKATLLPLLSSVMLSGCIIHVGGSSSLEGGSITSVLGSVTVPQGKVVDDITSVNGGIELSDDVIAEDVDTVNGDIELGENVTTRSLHTVNGDISSDKKLMVHRDVSTVNGDIELVQSEVSGELNTVNGDITLSETRIGDDLTTYNGDVSLLAHSYVKGDIVFERKRSKSQSSEPTLTIDSSSIVEGDIILYRNVELDIQNDALMQKVIRKDDR